MSVEVGSSMKIARCKKLKALQSLLNSIRSYQCDTGYLGYTHEHKQEILDGHKRKSFLPDQTKCSDITAAIETVSSTPNSKRTR